MALLDAFRKRRAIKTFSKRLGPALSAQFGQTSHYSADQIRDLVESPKFRRHREYLVYAYCLFMAPEDFQSLGPAAGSSDSFELLRAEAFGVIGPGPAVHHADIGMSGDAFQGPTDFDGGGGGGDAGM